MCRGSIMSTTSFALPAVKLASGGFGTRSPRHIKLISKAGIAELGDYARERRAGITRIAVVGDSFVEALQVASTDSLAEKLDAT